MATPVKIKHLWRGAFKFKKSANVLYAYAYTKKQAWMIMCKRIAKKHNVMAAAVMELFDGSQNNFEIKIELEIKEDNR